MSGAQSRSSRSRNPDEECGYGTPKRVCVGDGVDRRGRFLCRKGHSRTIRSHKGAQGIYDRWELDAQDTTRVEGGLDVDLYEVAILGKDAGVAHLEVQGRTRVS